MNELDSLDSLFKIIANNNFDTEEKLYEQLAPINIGRLKDLIQRLQRVEDASHSSDKRDKAFEGKRSKIKGKVYEKIIHTLFKDARGFHAYENVSTGTSELDILIHFGAWAGFVDPFRHWGSHCICECKNYGGNVQGTWIHKLNSVLQIHNAKVGLLFSKNGLTQRRSAARIAIQVMAGQFPSRVILCFSWDDIIACTEGKNFLYLLSQRHVELLANININNLLTLD